MFAVRLGAKLGEGLPWSLSKSYVDFVMKLSGIVDEQTVQRPRRTLVAGDADLPGQK